MAQGPVNTGQFIQWGLEVYEETVATLGLPAGVLYAETAHLGGGQSGGNGGKAFAWPMSAQLRVQNSLVRLDPVQHAPVLRTLSDQFRAEYWSEFGGGYRSGVASWTDRYYDDNAHIAVALAEAYDLTGEQAYLDRAEETLQFVLSGESLAGGGGVYWREGDYSFKDSAATLQGARAALKIHQATGDPAYFEHADRLYTWAQNTTQQPDGLFMEKLYLTGPKAGQVGDWTLVNFAGFGISANIEFYDSTGDVAYLSEAQRIANRSLTRYFDPPTGRINDEGYWAYELVDALVDLYKQDGDSRWIEAVEGGLLWLHDNKEDPNGHYGKFWGREGPQTSVLSSWNLNDQAPVARAYLHLGTVPEPSSLALLCAGAAGLFACALRRRRR